MTRIETLAGELDALRSEIVELDSTENLTEEQAARFAEALAEWDEKNAEHEALAARSAKVEAVRSKVVAAPKSTEKAFSAPDVVVRSGATDNPFGVDFDAMRLGQVPASEISSRALDGIELAERSGRLGHDGAEHASRMIQGKANNISRKSAVLLAEHVLRTGSDDYQDAFEKYIEDPQGYGTRAALSLTSANGGYLVPFTFDPTIILTNNGSANPFRQLANQKTTATNNWNGVSSAGVNAAWLAEGGVAADASPTFSNTQITPAKAAAWVFGSYEVLEDSDFAQSFPRLIADAKDRLEEAAFATGSGTNQPWGVVPRATTVASASVATFAAADIYAVQAALPARFRGPNARLAWVANLGIINRARQFDTAGGSSFWANLGMGQPEQLLGAPIYESTTMVSTITTGSKNLLLGDFSQYFIVDRIGTSVLYEPMVKDQATGRPTGQGGWFAFWRVGGDVSTSANSSPAFRVLTEA